MTPCVSTVRTRRPNMQSSTASGSPEAPEGSYRGTSVPTPEYGRLPEPSTIEVLSEGGRRRKRDGPPHPFREASRVVHQVMFFTRSVALTHRCQLGFVANGDQVIARWP